jgi:transcriptional regulator with XRE-family HTH domain
MPPTDDNQESQMANTPKGNALGGALRRARLDKNLTIRQLGALIGRNQGQISRWETGDQTPKPDQVAQILTVLGIKGADYDEIISMAYNPNDPTWVGTELLGWRQLAAACLDLEQQATSVTTVSPYLVPGQLQTDDYIRAIMNVGLSPEDAAARTAERIRQRAYLDRPRLERYTALIGEATLYQQIGGPRVLREQIRHLAGMANLPKFDVRIVPFNSAWNPAIVGPFVILECERSRPVVMVEYHGGALLLHEAVDLETYRRGATMALDAALSQDDSRRLLARVLDRMEKRT